MRVPLSALLLAAVASPAPAQRLAAPQALMGCWTSVHAENHWDDGQITALNTACTRFFSADRLHVGCRAPNGGPVSAMVFGYMPLSAGSFSVQWLESGKQSYVTEYLRPHEFVLGAGQLTLTSYPRLPKTSAGRLIVKTVSRFVASPAQSGNAAACVPPQPPG